MLRYSPSLSVVAAFGQVVERFSGKTALILPGRNGNSDVSLSYSELDKRANAVAAALLDRGVRPGDFVATLLEKSIETIVGFLGILKAGCAYVPLDPAYPAERLAFMLAETEAKVILTQPNTTEDVPASLAVPLVLRENFGHDFSGSLALPTSSADDLAYVIFTSGSTGKPKGVMVPHRGIVRLVRENDYTPLDETRVLLQLAPVSFDAATLEIWGALLQGGTCVLYPVCGVPEAALLKTVIERNGVTTLWLTSSLFNLMIDRSPEAIISVQEVLAGGEALSVPHIRKALRLLPNTQLVNGYGPTESTTFTCCYRIPKTLEENLTSIPIGKAIAHTSIYILGADQRLVVDGEVGDLFIGGDGLARGYLKRPELTRERFIDSPFAASEKLYATGDRVRKLPDGNLEFCGRLDDQVKISGHRIELGEIETALGELEGVKQVVVLAREDNPGDKRLVAYLVAEGLTAGKLRTLLGARMPSYMIPAAFVFLSALPLSPMGKVDRKALPKPGTDRPELEQAYVAPRNALENLLSDLWCEALELAAVGINDRFFELGGTSLAAVRFVARLSSELGVAVPIVAFFDAPTVAAIATVLSQDFAAAVHKRFGELQTAPTPTQPTAHPKPTSRRSGEPSAFAIVGLAGRFPGARNSREFWRNLRAGVCSSRALTREELESSGLDPKLLDDPDYVARAFVLEEAESWDAAFFGFSPREAELMDPQQRIFIETAYAALEDAGYDPSRYDGRIGVFGGVGRNAYMLENLAHHPELAGRLIEHSNQIGNERDFPPTHVAYKLNLRGPAVNVQTACSTAGVALHLACQSLREGDCDMVLVGGAKVLFPALAGYPYVDGGALASDGVVRAFDAKASGMVRGSGCGFVVVKPLEQALADGDQIRAVIRATAINNDGGAKIGFAAPSAQGQSEVIARALEKAELSPEDISYVETHGTGTVLGDPIEVLGLTRAFGRPADGAPFCGLGSVKTNIGHLDASALAAGLIKTVLALENEELPPSLNFDTPNPAIAFEGSPFYVNAKLKPWPRTEKPRRAGVSSFGLGGTNAHVIVEEAPLREPRENKLEPQLLLLSTKTATALAKGREELAAFLSERPELPLEDVAFTLGQGRRRFAARAAVVARTNQEAADALRASDVKRCEVMLEGKDASRVVFMFPGGGAQYVGMARGLQGQPVFDAKLAECAAHLQPLLGLDIRALIYPEAESNREASLERPFFALPTLLAIELSLAALLESYGVTPAAMIGHSMGEYAAAHLAGVMSLKDALGIVTCRGRLFEKLPRGSMLGVPLSAKDLTAHLQPGLSTAAINRPQQCVASGHVEAIEQLATKLEALEIEVTRIHIDVAAHSELVEPILPEFLEYLRTLEFAAPTLPFVSNVTGTWITAAQAQDPNYWAAHLRSTVRFADGIDTVLETPGTALIEVGPGRTLSTLAKSHPRLALPGARHVVTSTVRHPQEPVDDLSFLLKTVGRLWLAGLDLNHAALAPDARRTSLPTYPFERRRFVATAASPAKTSAALTVTPPSPPPSAVAPAIAAAVPAPVLPEAPPPPPARVMTMSSRKDRLATEIARILADLSGMEADKIDPRATFLELGFDSLFLTQANGSFRKRFGVKTTVRQLLEKAPGVLPLAEFLDGQMPADAFPAEAQAEAAPAPAAAAAPTPTAAPIAAELAPAQATAFAAAPAALPFVGAAAGAPASAIERVIANQLAVMQEQLAVLRGAPSAAQAVVAQPVVAQAAAAAIPMTSAPQAAPAALTAAPKVAAAAPEPEKKANKESPWAPVEKNADISSLPPEQQAHLDELIAKVVARAPTSKQMTQEHRRHFADPRTVQGFKLQWKDMVFPIVAAKSEGSKMWDVDGNEYIDLVNGYGATFLGHNTPFIREAVKAQLERGVEIGPQNYLAGKLAKLFCEMTGNERAAFCNTGSEAVLAALRLARTVTGKDGIATFSGHYHGIFDEVLVKGSMMAGKRRTLPIAPGIPQRHVEKTLVLNYGDMASLDAIRKHADELAIVLVEPIRSRNPNLQPVEFVRALRALTEELNIILLFDEMVTGFRAHPGGMQALWGIRADLATYGKVVGGEFPIGVVAGKAKLMDALDGGHWQYGDNSVPEADMTWFAGTFVRHPVAMASAYATLSYLKEQGPSLQEELGKRTAAFGQRMNEYFQECGAPLVMEWFSSFVVLKFTSFQEYSQLLFYHLHNRGIFTYEGRPAFFTTAHTDEDFAKIEAAMRESVEVLQRVGFFPGTPVQREPREIAMSEGQQEIWLATRFGSDASCAFNLASTLQLKGALALDKLQIALNLLSKRHEALRCVPNQDGLTQRVMPPGEVKLPFTDLSSLSQADRDARLAEIKQREVTVEFDLEQGPLFRTQLIKLGPDEHFIILTAHHLIADGWSCGVICRELGKIYASVCDGKPAELEQAMPYSEWIDQQRGAAASAERKTSEAYWVSQYAGRPIPVLDLPSDRPRPAVKSFAADRISLKFDEPFVAEIKKMAGKQGATLFAGVLAGFHVLLARLSGQSDVVVGFSLAGQSDVEGRALVGHCVQFLPLRLELGREQSFADHVKHVRGKVFDAFEFKNFTFGTLIKQLAVPRDPSRVPLMSVAFNLDPNSLGIGFHDLQCTVGSVPRRYENFDIFFNLVESNTGVEVQATFNLDLFDRETVRRRLEQYRVLLEAAVRDANQKSAELPLMTESERQRLLVDWNQTQAVAASRLPVHELFQAHADRSPLSIAVRGDHRTLTYGELEQRANQLAHLLAGRGASEGKRIGVSLPRTPELVISLLAVLKTGAAYVPIDPALPEDRVRFMLDDAGCELLLSHTENPAVEGLAASRVFYVDQASELLSAQSSSPLGRDCPQESVAYVAYTSGSTGKPKGVMIPHRALTHYLSWAIVQYEMKSGSGSPVHSSIGFDLTITSLFGPLAAGNTVQLLSDTKDVAALAKVLRDPGGFSVVKLTPAHLGILAAELPKEALATGALTLVVGGEQLEAAHVAAFRAHAPNVKIWNEYGPTETTVGCCIHLVNADSPQSGAIPIGRPAPGTKLYVLDDRRQPVPIGVSGELYIGGPQVGLGYLNQPELTRERFIDSPFESGATLYRTGDLVKYRSSGELEFLGRVDKQVKIRGYRIELGEVESVLRSSEWVASAAVIASGTSAESRTLTAFIVPKRPLMLKAGSSLVDELRRHLHSTLPEYMVPGTLVELESLPLTDNGKVDEKALQGQLATVAGTSKPAFVAPTSETGIKVAQLFAEALGVARVSLHDSFFELGGHSLMGIQLIVRLRESLGVPELSLSSLFSTPTVAGLSERIDALAYQRSGGAVDKSGEREEVSF